MGLVALSEARSHRPIEPVDVHKAFPGGHVLGVLNLYGPGSGWSRTAYDVAHIGGAALLVVGALLAMAGLISLARRPVATQR